MRIVYAILLFGCQSQKDFDLREDESYCGTITSADFLRRNFREDARLELHGYSSRQAACPAGKISTDDGMLQEAELRPIEVLAHDSLSQLQFGDGRLDNEIYFVRTTRGQDLLAVLSLMSDGGVELRLLGAAQASASSDPDAGPELPPCPGSVDAGVEALPETPLFGLFHLRRDRAGCL